MTTAGGPTGQASDSKPEERGSTPRPAATLRGFPYDAAVEAMLKKGRCFSREYVGSVTGHRHRVTLSWLDAHDCPLVSDLDVDLAVRVTG